MLVAITGHDIALLVNGAQYGEDVGVLMQVYMPEEGHVELALTTNQIDNVQYMRLMDSRGNEFVGDAYTGDIRNIGGALGNYFRAMGFVIDDIFAQPAEVSEPLFRLPSSGSFNPVGFRYGGLQPAYQSAMSRMSEGDEFAVFVSGIYVLNRLERSGSTLVYRAYILPCNPAVEDAGLIYGYEGDDNIGFDITDASACLREISESVLSDWWNQAGALPLPYQFERVVYYTDSMRLMPLLFVDF